MVFGCTVSFSQSDAGGQKNLSELAEIDKAHKNLFRWLIAKEMDSLDMILHHDMRYIHSNGWTENKKEVLENIRSNKLTYHAVNIEDSYVRMEGNTGIVIGKAHFSVALEGSPIEIYLLYTEVFVKIANQWQCISRHACRLP